MIIKNYPQFSKKTLFLGVEKKYFLLFIFIQTPIYFVFLLTTTALISIAIIVSSYLLSVIAFAKNNYVLEKTLIKIILKINHILPR
jgi:hypothetical protein